MDERYLFSYQVWVGSPAPGLPSLPVYFVVIGFVLSTYSQPSVQFLNQTYPLYLMPYRTIHLHDCSALCYLVPRKVK